MLYDVTSTEGSNAARLRRAERSERNKPNGNGLCFWKEADPRRWAHSGGDDQFVSFERKQNQEKKNLAIFYLKNAGNS